MRRQGREPKRATRVVRAATAQALGYRCWRVTEGGATMVGRGA